MTKNRGCLGVAMPPSLYSRRTFCWTWSTLRSSRTMRRRWRCQRHWGDAGMRALQYLVGKRRRVLCPPDVCQECCQWISFTGNYLGLCYLKLMADGPSFFVQETRTRILVQEVCPCVISSRTSFFSRTRNLDELEQCSIVYVKVGVTWLKVCVAVG